MGQKSFLCLLITAVVATSCGGTVSELELATVAAGATATPFETSPAGEFRPTATGAATEDGPENTTPVPSATPSPAPANNCADMADQVGRTVVCVIPRAHCSYREDVSGSPTFCNDAPFPTHEFTLLVWGQDWSELDGRCLKIEGYLSRYQGKPQIVAESREQVALCD